MKFIVSLFLILTFINSSSNNSFTYLNSNYLDILNNIFIAYKKQKVTIKSKIDERLVLGPTADEEPSYLNPLPSSQKLDISSISFGYEQERLRSYIELSKSGSELKIYSLLFDYYFSKNERLDFFVGSGVGYVKYNQTGLQAIDTNLSVDTINQTGYTIPIKLGLNFKINNNLSIRSGFSWSKVIAPSRHTIDYLVDDKNSTSKSNVFLTSVREIFLSLEFKF